MTSLSVLFFSFFFSSRRRHTRYWRDRSSDVCSSDLCGARHPVSLAAQAGSGTERHGPPLARTEAAHRRQSAGHLGECSGQRCRRLGAGTDTPAGAPQGRDGFEALLAQEPGRRLLATYLAGWALGASSFWRDRPAGRGAAAARLLRARAAVIRRSRTPRAQKTAATA